MKKQSFIIKYEVYPYELMVLVGYTFPELEKLIQKRIPKDIHDEIDLLGCDCFAETMMFSNGATIMHIHANVPKARLNGVIVHESFHATKFLMDEIGQTLTNESEESYAYLTQYISEQIMRRVK